MRRMYLKFVGLFRFLRTGVIIAIPGKRKQYRLSIERKMKIFFWPKVTKVGKKNLTKVCLETWQFLHDSFLGRARIAGTFWKNQASNSHAEKAKIAVQQTVDETLAKFRDQVIGGLNQTIDRQVNSSLNSLIGLAVEIIAAQQTGPSGNNSAAQCGILPEYTRLIFTYSNIEIVALEIPPQRRTLVFTPGTIANMLPEPNDNRRGSNAPQFHLAMPYTIFFLKFVQKNPSLKVFYRNHPLRSLEDKLYRASLPNVGSDGAVCLGQYLAPRQGTLAERVEHLMDFYWTSKFTYFQGGDNYLNYPDVRVRNLWAWERASQRDPLFVTQIGWKHTPFTLGMVWTSLCAEAWAKRERAALKNQFGNAIAPAIKELKSAIKTYCEGLKTDTQFSKAASESLAIEINASVAEILENVASELGDGGHESEVWEHFLDLLTNPK